MGEIDPLVDALATAKQLHNMVIQLETGLQLANGLTERNIEPGIMHVYAGDYIQKFIEPAIGLIDRLERLQDKYFLIREPVNDYACYTRLSSGSARADACD